MAMTCNDCGYYTTEQEEKCPKCNTKLQITFLPPRGAAMTPPPALPKPLAPGTPSYPMPGFRGTYDLFEIILRNRFAVALVAVPLFLFGTWMIGMPAGGLQSKYQSIRMGMAADEVHRILYSDSKFTSASRVPTSGDAQLSYSEGPVKIVVDFRNGKVVNKRLTGLRDALRDDDDS